MKERFEKIIERWYITESALFRVYGTHNLEENSEMKCAIRTGKGRIEYNPKLASALPDKQLESSLKAEMIRILLKHPYERQVDGCRRESMSVGSNLVIGDNYDFRDIKLQRPKEYNLPRGESYEWYAHRMEEMVKDKEGGPKLNTEPDKEDSGASVNDKGQSESTPIEDVSSLWEEDGLMACNIDATIDEIEANGEWGSLAGQISERIIAGTKARIDYRRVLSGFRASILSSKRQLTRMRPNRRHGFEAMGSIRRFSTRILVAVDVSGSIRDYTLAEFYGIINRAFRYGVEQIDTVQFDIELKEVVPMRRAKREIEIKGRGGTAFQPVLDYVAEHTEYDGLLILTDGVAPIPVLPKNLKCSIMWVCTTKRQYDRYHKWMQTMGRCCMIEV